MSLNAPAKSAIDGSLFSIGIVAARFNDELVGALLDTLRADLAAAGVKEERIRLMRVPGSNELPVAAAWMARSPKMDCVVALGVLIKGDTKHHQIVGQSVTDALQQVALATGTPVINGVLVVESPKQAKARCIGKINRGGEFAQAALEMAALNRSRRAKR